MLRALAFIAMGQQHHQAVGPKPFGLTRRDELVNHGLRAVHEVAKLRLPKNKRFRLGTGIAIFETKHAKFR